jgi:beta-lactam-binding protein with PASTA domain
VPTSGPLLPPVIVPVVAGGADGRIPDLTGLSARDAAGALSRLRMGARMFGAGLVVEQQPAPGTVIDPGGRVTLWLSRQHAVPRTPVAQEP